MSKHPGKKIGTLEVKLDRKKTRYKWASVNVELRFEITHGTFHAQCFNHDRTATWARVQKESA
jgi:hypothetical protein